MSTITKEEKNEIIDYMMSFYGFDEGIYADIFDNKLSKLMIYGELDEFISIYDAVSKRAGYDGFDGFDTPQREMYRDWLLMDVFNTSVEELEYESLMKEMREYRREEFVSINKLRIK
jgi:hypothetical protein